jgi:capsular exopolysaccharide synthesis family protein
MKVADEVGHEQVNALQPRITSSGVTIGSDGNPGANIVMLQDPQGPRAEAIRALRTHVIAQHVHGGRRALAICAASYDVGCTFVAANLAVALSQVGLKTLLIDADLRQPSVDTFIHPRDANGGLRRCLANPEISFLDVIDSEVLPNFSVLQSGGPASDAQELLGGERFEALMEVCLRDFDVTIVDTPPANSCADARRVSSVVGYSLVVARQGRSLVDDIKTLVGELQGDRAIVIGTVLNEA